MALTGPIAPFVSALTNFLFLALSAGALTTTVFPIMTWNELARDLTNEYDAASGTS
jgi:hypothetical protein